MQSVKYVHVYNAFISFLVSRVVIHVCASLTVADHYPLWPIGVCHAVWCQHKFNGVILCGGMDTIAIMPGYCMTWENVYNPECCCP